MFAGAFFRGPSGGLDVAPFVGDRAMLLSDPARAALIKVPAVTLGFWVIKILATTLGETVGGRPSS